MKRPSHGPSPTVFISTTIFDSPPDSSTRTTTISASISANEIPPPSSLISSRSPTMSSSTPIPPNDASQASTSPLKHSLSTGVIVAAVIGSLFVLVVGIVILVYCHQHNSRRKRVVGHISPLRQDMTRRYELGVLDVDAVTISASKNPQSNFLSSFSGSPRPSTSTRVQDDVRVQMIRMEATMGRMADHMDRLESQLEWTGATGARRSDPPPTYVPS
ncbi:hypothetical protein BDP27DRAFT_1450910 [Rhodocollybia butyracea]|uniref:Uncharacterized protein n=1 Tax=Rhodocollybia butyracea TaxID=206335 RepID=A0A9P5U1Y6_9AGAR|nr:hypothetical protein BDP27DRAFT_1450910 [Rhodocollybia butyracea]